jgi:hypothetical protein
MIADEENGPKARKRKRKRGKKHHTKWRKEIGVGKKKERRTKDHSKYREV